jgi:hypothetical protein
MFGVKNRKCQSAAGEDRLARPGGSSDDKGSGKTEIRDQRSEVSGQKSEARSQKSEAGGQDGKAWP